MIERMPDLALTYAGADYWDRTLALITGATQPAGIDLTYSVLPLHEIFRRMIRDEAFDASEMALSTLIALIAHGDRRFVALPIFPSRAFRHGYVFVPGTSELTDPRHLAGKTVGLPEYEMTTALWVRGLLQHEYGVAAGEIRWRVGGLLEPGYVARSGLKLASGIDLEVIPQ